MSNFDFIRWMMHDQFRCLPPYHEQMIEEQGDDMEPQRIDLRYRKSITNVVLYKFDTGKRHEFLPFFNGDRSDVPAPRGLMSFCDYISLVQHDGKLYIVLFELKRGDMKKAESQLNASRLFMQYVLDSAERIKSENGMDAFDSSEIGFRRVIIRRPASNKMRTKQRSYTRQEKESVLTIYRTSDFTLNEIIP